MTHQRSGELTSLLATLAALGMHEHSAILRSLVDGPCRFNELLAGLPRLDDVMLGAGLRELDAEGLAARRVDPGPPLRVLYELTPAGGSLATTLVELKQWTDTHAS
ncbi:MAG: winged helix-turn-helix transcriptional regulator [Candidatus Eremiobacteraeota bacterium]|nr:winged helix-turn-helix transcriptional regulator [Candidatus Eremiobacteraeota bacterium]